MSFLQCEQVGEMYRCRRISYLRHGSLYLTRPLTQVQDSIHDQPNLWLFRVLFLNFAITGFIYLYGRGGPVIGTLKTLIVVANLKLVHIAYSVSNRDEFAILADPRLKANSGILRDYWIFGSFLVGTWLLWKLYDSLFRSYAQLQTLLRDHGNWWLMFYFTKCTISSASRCFSLIMLPVLGIGLVSEGGLKATERMIGNMLLEW